MSTNLEAGEPTTEAALSPRVRVGIVDDTPDMRLLLRMMFERDQRFEVVGEGGDGVEAIELVTRLQPDLLVLDRQMPTLGGIEALPDIRASAPRTAVIVYTAQTDTGTRQAALAAGALDVVDKSASGPSFVDQLADVLLGHWSGPEAIEVRIGPVASSAALAWIDNSTGIVESVRAHRDELDERIDADALDALLRFLATWRAIAATSEEFSWVARALPSEVTRLVEAWATIDRLPDDMLHRLGCDWSPPAGQPFFRALTEGVLTALQAHHATQQLALALSPKWQESTEP